MQNAEYKGVEYQRTEAWRIAYVKTHCAWCGHTLWMSEMEYKRLVDSHLRPVCDETGCEK